VGFEIKPTQMEDQKTITVKFTKKENDRVRRVAKANGLTAYAMLHQMTLHCLNEMGEEGK